VPPGRLLRAEVALFEHLLKQRVMDHQDTSRFLSPAWARWPVAKSWLPAHGGFIHTIRTACPRVMHSPHHLSTRCGCRRRRALHTVRAVSQTPTYDQLRGERINADVPPSEVAPPRLSQPGKHHPLGAPGLSAHGPSREAKADPATTWSWFESVEAGPSGKHHLSSEVPDAAEVADPSQHHQRVAPDSTQAKPKKPAR
jgi:hypothetical protein